MSDLILSIIFISAFCNGIYFIMGEGMILHPLLKWMDKNLVSKRGEEVKYHFLYKPLGGCLTCMASIWGSLAYWTIYDYSTYTLIMWPFVIVCVAYTNNVLNRFI